MDSGNSGSIQSSSGAAADEECDSRATAFITTHHQPPFNHHHMFDEQNQINNPPLFFTASPQHQHQLLNPHSKTLPSFFPSSSQPTNHTVPFSPMTTTAEPISGRNPKKRSRASRRAPTTVLTTDTSNFRAMVQEFTGIPAPPFTPSPLSFDLFGRPNNFDNLPQLPAYLLPQKLHSSSFTTMQMQNTISLNQSPFLNPKATQNLVSSNSQIHQLHTSLPDLVSSKGTDDQMASGNYNNGKESSCVMTDHHHHSSPGMKADSGFIEPWICSSD